MITLAAIPVYLDVADTAFAQDQPVKASTFQQLAHNAKFAMVRREVFVGAFTHGQTIAAPKSAIDGYQYAYSEITFWWTRNFSYSPTTKKPSGGGCVLQWNDAVNAAGVVSMETDYYIDGGAESPTNDGQLIVYLFCQRAITMPGGSVVSWADVEDPDLAGGQYMDAANLLQLNRNIRYAALRKEFFVQTLYNGQTAALPLSPVDGYAYQRSELIYAPSMIASWSSGGTRSGSGTVRQFGCNVGGMQGVTTPATAGQVASFVNYYVNGGAETLTNDGKILVLIVATRSQGSAPIPPAVRVQPPAANANSFGSAIVSLDPTATIDGQPASSVVLGSVTGTQRNRVPNSGLKLGAPEWGAPPAGFSIVTVNGGNGWKIDANADQNPSMPVYFGVTPGEQITISSYMDASAMTSGYLLVGLDWAGRGSTVWELSAAAGQAAQRFSATHTVPAGVTQMRIYWGEWSLSGSPAGVGYIAQIQVESGSVMTAYRESVMDDLTGGLQSGIQVQEPDGSLSPNTLGEVHKRGRLGLNASGQLQTGTVATPVASLDTGARRANTAIDAGNVLVAGSADFSRAYLGKHLGNIPDDATSGRLARRSAYIGVGGSATWINLGTWTFPADGGGYALHVTGLGGQGFNSGSNQQAKIDILVRSGDGGIDNVAPNISGVTWIGHGNSAFVGSVKVISHGGSTAPTQNQWDVLVSVNSFSSAHWDFYCDARSSFATSGATTTDPGAGSTTVVVGAGQYVHDTSANLYGALLINGTSKTSIGLHDLHDRVAATINGYGGAGLANVPDDATSARYAVLAIDANRRAIIDGASAHENWNQDHLPDGSTYARTLAAGLSGGYAAKTGGGAHNIKGVGDAQTLSLDSEVADGASYVRLANVNADHTLHASTALNPQGNLLPSQGVAFSISSGAWTGSAFPLTISWSATTLKRPDGSTMSIAAGSQGPTNCAASTTFIYYPRINTTGTPAVDMQGGPVANGDATKAQNMYLDGYMPAVGDPSHPFAMITTPAAGGSPPSGGGGSSTCPADDQPMEARRPDGREEFVWAAEIEAGWEVRDWGGGWNQVSEAFSFLAHLHYVTVIDAAGREETYHVDLAHLWALRPDPDAKYRGDWVRSAELRPGHELASVDGPVSVVRVSWPPHLGDCRKIKCDRHRMRLGKLIGHNYSSA